MKILSITVVNTGGADTVLFNTDLPEPVWPYTGTATLKTESARHMTDQFLSTYFPDVPVKKVGV
jgi:hypothetical protein